MPVFRSGEGLAPEWCEMNFFEIVELPVGAKHTFKRIGPKEKLIVGNGQCSIAFADKTIDAKQGANLDLVIPVGQFEVLEALSNTTLIRLCGHWGDEIGGSGIFTAEKATWGTRIGNTCLVEHEGNLYFYVAILKSLGYRYESIDGQPLEKDFVHGMMRAKSNPKQELEQKNEVQVRRYKLESIKAISLNGFQYIVV